MHQHERLSKRILISISAGIVVVALLFASFWVGFKSGAARSETFVVTGVTGTDPKVKDVDFNLFWEAWSKLKELHINGGKTDSQALLYGALAGLAGSFDDPHTVFFPPEESEKFEEDVAGYFGGIGAEIGFNKDKVLSVIAPLKGTPAEQQGVQAGDLILKIDGESTQGLSVDEAVSRIRGEAGTSVTLSMYREAWPQPKDISITRKTITAPTLDIEFIDNIAHIELYSFNENAVNQFTKAAQQLLMREKPRGIILDLRNNPGGYLEVAIQLAGFFVEPGTVVVSEEFKDGERMPFATSGSGILKDVPVVVIQNGGSASASEILAGALRDIRGVKLVGTKSYGKGTVQELEPLSDDSSLKITIARWILPSGHNLDKEGLSPDYEVELSEEDVETKRDPQFEKALEVLKAQL